jgi:predicted aconitase
VGLHTEEGRRATLQVDLDVPDHLLADDLFYPVLGHVLGRIAGSAVAALVGLDERATEDRLKALGAAAASSGAVAMFHAVGVTPEAATLLEATGGVDLANKVTIDVDDLRAARVSLGPAGGPLDAVSVGTPHFSLEEMKELARLVVGRVTRVPFYVNTSREVLTKAEREGWFAPIESYGATIVTDTCTYITPIMETSGGVVMTNSGKWAFYAPGNLGVEVAIAGLEACVDSATSGEIVLGDIW